MCNHEESLCWKQGNWDIFIASQSATLENCTLNSFGNCEGWLQNKQKPHQTSETCIYLGNSYIHNEPYSLQTLANVEEDKYSLKEEVCICSVFL